MRSALFVRPLRCPSRSRLAREYTRAFAALSASASMVHCMLQQNLRPNTTGFSPPAGGGLYNHWVGLSVASHGNHARRGFGYRAVEHTGTGLPRRKAVPRAKGRDTTCCIGAREGCRSGFTESACTRTTICFRAAPAGRHTSPHDSMLGASTAGPARSVSMRTFSQVRLGTRLLERTVARTTNRPLWVVSP